jgi:hypothetical protein
MGAISATSSRLTQKRGQNSSLELSTIWRAAFQEYSTLEQIHLPISIVTLSPAANDIRYQKSRKRVVLPAVMLQACCTRTQLFYLRGHPQFYIEFHLPQDNLLSAWHLCSLSTL